MSGTILTPPNLAHFGKKFGHPYIKYILSGVTISNYTIHVFISLKALITIIINISVRNVPVVSEVWWEVGWCRWSCGKVHTRYTDSVRCHLASTVGWRWNHSSHTLDPPWTPPRTRLKTFIQTTQTHLRGKINTQFVLIRREHLVPIILSGNPPPPKKRVGTIKRSQVNI